MTLQEELLSEIQLLSPVETKLVINYARTLRTTDISKSGQVYLEMIASQGASPAEILRAAQAVQKVERELATSDPKTHYAELDKRTELHMRHWLRERGMDYDTITDEEFDEIVDDAVQKYRNRH